ARLGRLIQYIPFTVTQGFTSAIGVVIGVLQLKDFLGLPIAKLPEGFLAQAATIGARIGEARVEDFSIGLATFVTLVFWPRVTKRVPAPLVALVLGAALAEAARRWAPGFSVATVGSRFANAVSPPSFALPWTLPGAHGETFAFDFDAVRRLLPSAFAIALLVSIESLLSAVVADALMGTNHDPDAELMAQGTGNFAAAFFGGFGATGALARTATNVRAGARSPVSAVVHAAVLLAVSAWAAPWIAYLPMASLAALLMMTAWNLADVRYFARLLRQSPSHDVVVLMTCFVLTLVFDMEVGVTAGVTLASLLFMRRMSESVGFRTAAPSPASQEAPPPGVVFYEVAGPFFFGAAAKLVSRLKDVLGSARCLVLDVGAVPFIDATGLVNLRSVVDRLRVRRTPILLARVQPEVARALRRAGLEPEPGVFELHDDPQSAAASARAIAAGDVPWGRTPAPPRGA
ncbi:MAG TPA: SulP family inorganic anion transporter, partial [Planctomycetota bacterium]|nr:SulP family inorganic anion transporter [Planctomycetota bacterium]